MRRSGAAQGAIARELDALLGAGLLQRYEEGRNVFYRANKHAPVFADGQLSAANCARGNRASRSAVPRCTGKPPMLRKNTFAAFGSKELTPVATVA